MNESIIPQIYPVTSHTDYVGNGTTFVVVQGKQENGIQYAPLAIAKGATTLVVEHNQSIPISLQELIKQKNIVVIYTENSRKALADLSAQALNYPSRLLKIIAVSGTKGKTTTSFLIEHVLKQLGFKTALLTSVYNILDGQQLETDLTTRQPDYLHHFFAACLQAKVDYVVMEVAAQAISLYRIEGLSFDGIVMTNFSQEHAEFYPNIEAYFAAKASLLNYKKGNAPFVINADEPYFQSLKTHQDSKPFGLNGAVSIKGEILQSDAFLTLLKVIDGNKQYLLKTTMLGTFNVYNLLGVITLFKELHFDVALVCKLLESSNPVPGRLERYELPNGACAVIDYASNPASFESILTTLRSLTDHLIVVFGAGGDRDKTKRPLMGALAMRYADHIIITTDNPRFEDPATIVQHILSGIKLPIKDTLIVQPDRQQAIHMAYQISRKSSIIALLGKGAEQYQIINNLKIPFSEKTIIKSLV